MTGIDDPYEAPEHPELTFDQATRSAAAASEIDAWVQLASRRFRLTAR